MTSSNAAPTAAAASTTASAGYSVLAFVECVLATGGLAYAILVFDARMYLLSAVLIAPLMLLQTDYGNAVKGKLFKICEPIFRPAIVRTVVPKLALMTGVVAALYLYESPSLEGDGMARVGGAAFFGAGMFLLSFVGFTLLWIGALAAISLLIRFVSTVTAFGRHPADCLMSIPLNWDRVCFRTDFRTPPELFPGAETVAQYSIRQYFWRFREELLKLAKDDKVSERSWIERVVRALESAFQHGLIYLGAGFATALLFLVAASYRISLKSTFLIYLPFFYFASRALFEKQSFPFLRGIQESVADKVIAAFILTTHMLLPVAIAFLVGAAIIPQPGDSLVKALLNYWSFTPVLSANAITKFTNAVLVFVCWALAIHGMRLLKAEDHPAKLRTTAALRLLIALRAVLTIYSIVYVAVLISYHVNADQVSAGWQGVVRVLQSVRVDWSPLPGAPS